MTLDQLLTVEAIVTQGSFKAAADFLHKSQPSISMAIKKLEEEYQIVLFSRDEYRPTLSIQGKIFYEKTQSLLKEYRELESLATIMGTGVEAEIRVSIDAVSPLDLVLKFFRDFFKNYPDTKLTLQYEVLSGTIERLLDNEVELAITPKPVTQEGLELKKITQTKLIYAISKDLVAKNGKIDEKFLSQHSQVILADSARRITKVTTGVVNKNKTVTVNDIAFKKELIMQGLGWGGLPVGMIANEIKAKKLIPIDIKNVHDRVYDIYLVRLKNSTLGPVASKLWESMSEMD